MLNHVWSNKNQMSNKPSVKATSSLDDLILSAIFLLRLTTSLGENFPYSEFFWSVFGPNAGKYGPEKLRIGTLFTQCFPCI